MRKYLIVTLFAGAAVTIAMASVYAAVQQNYRQSANDPQIQVAEDATAALAGGYPITSLVSSITSTVPVDMSKSLGTFMMAFDENGALLGSSGSMGVKSGTSTSLGTAPVPPAGVFEHARSQGENRVTWQTPTGERFAAVVRHWKSPASSGFILVARSLREIENRELQTELIVGGAWAIMLVLGIGTVALIRYLP